MWLKAPYSARVLLKDPAPSSLSTFSCSPSDPGLYQVPFFVESFPRPILVLCLAPSRAPCILVSEKSSLKVTAHDHSLDASVCTATLWGKKGFTFCKKHKLRLTLLQFHDSFIRGLPQCPYSSGESGTHLSICIFKEIYSQNNLTMFWGIPDPFPSELYPGKREVLRRQSFPLISNTSHLLFGAEFPHPEGSPARARLITHRELPCHGAQTDRL